LIIIIINNGQLPTGAPSFFRSKRGVGHGADGVNAMAGVGIMMMMHHSMMMAS
jgi:hypothetical protein